jgi:FMN phosphatase YigB (HAD superfamily)
VDAAVTIDFHDTLFICDDWFQLEVHDLVPAYLSWKAERDGVIVEPAVLERAAGRYRAMRLEIIERGEEQDAAWCVSAVCRALEIPFVASDVAAGIDTLMRATLANAFPREGARELLTSLRNAGVRTAIISNAIYHPFLEWCLAVHGLAELFDAVVTSASAGFYKSRVEIYQQTIDLLDVSSRGAIHLGDSYRYDVLGARRAGMGTAWLDLQREAGPGHLADLVTDRLTGLDARLLDLLDRRLTGLPGAAR